MPSTETASRIWRIPGGDHSLPQHGRQGKCPFCRAKFAVKPHEGDATFHTHAVKPGHRSRKAAVVRGKICAGIEEAIEELFE